MAKDHQQVQDTVIWWLWQTKHKLAWDEATWGAWRVDVLGLGKFITAVEVKVSRSDFLKDFCSREKAEKAKSNWDNRIKAANKNVETQLTHLEKRLGARLENIDLDHVKWSTWKQATREGWPEVEAYRQAVAEHRQMVAGQARSAGRGGKAVDLLRAQIANRYIIATPPKLITPEEVPPGWGWIEVGWDAYVRVRAPIHKLADPASVARAWIRRCATRCSHAMVTLRAANRKLQDKINDLLPQKKVMVP